MTLVAAALVPETVLMLPGGAGRAAGLAEVREHALRVVDDLVAAAPGRVVVVVAGPARTLDLPTIEPRGAGAPRLSLGALGLPDDVLGESDQGSVPGVAAQPGVHEPVVHEPGAVVALTLLRAVGYDGPVTLHVLGPDEGAPSAAALGAAVQRAHEAVALVLVGSLSARRGPSAPLPEDPRAAPFADRTTAALMTLSPDDLAHVRGCLDEADALAASAALPCVVLVGAVDAGARLDVRHGPHAQAPFGADLLVLGWRRTHGASG